MTFFFIFLEVIYFLHPWKYFLGFGEHQKVTLQTEPVLYIEEISQTVGRSTSAFRITRVLSVLSVNTSVCSSCNVSLSFSLAIAERSKLVSDPLLSSSSFFYYKIITVHHKIQFTITFFPVLFFFLPLLFMLLSFFYSNVFNLLMHKKVT